MPKRPRLKGTDLYHHIYAWGNNRNPLFKIDEHYEKYLGYLAQQSLHYRIDVIAYALLEWHVHLFIYDRSEKISQLMNSLHGRYAQYFNKVTKRVGHVFGERYNNKVVQPNNYGMWLSRYIHRQAVEAGIVNDPKDYPWTSYRAYLGLVPCHFLKPSIILKQFGSGRTAVRRYEAFVLGIDENPIDWRLRSKLIIGDDTFVKKITSSSSKEFINRKNSERADIDLLFKQISKRLGVQSKISLKPVNKTERLLRQEVMRILVEEYELSLRTVGRLFKVSAPAVLKILRTYDRKVNRLTPAP